MNPVEAFRTAAAWEPVRHNKPRARQFYSRVLNRYLWRVHSPSMYDGCGTTLDGAIRVFRANNQLT